MAIDVSRHDPTPDRRGRGGCGNDLRNAAKFVGTGRRGVSRTSGAYFTSSGCCRRCRNGVKPGGSRQTVIPCSSGGPARKRRGR